ncbi:RNA polymerase sigma factor [Nakamurella alba]|uniref:RNA polymerase sigma factor n=1 Tax=Nakamurella alba TaxID=2665158 RepID=UPI002AC33FF2|nr:sigma-70 family RNA polymerase sigma factor [Nakamurella alba]
MPIVAGLIRTTGDWELAEDCLQDAVERALQHWPLAGTPDNPAAWLATTARRRAVDILRRRRTESDKLQTLAQEPDEPVPPTDVTEGGYGDDVLRLLFTCCHPALPRAGQVALTLRTVAGLEIKEIARAFLTSEGTMGRRLLRAREKIRHAGIAFRVPPPHRVAERTAGVLAVIYLVFNEGYSASAGAGPRTELAEEAIRLARLTADLLPTDGEVLALQALLLFQHSRRHTRFGPDGAAVPMPEQDRSRWDRTLINEAFAALHSAEETAAAAGPYRWQARIAAEHVRARTPQDTDWSAIVTGFDGLLQLQPSPVIALNRAVAISFRDGAAAGLRELDAVADEPGLRGYHLVPAVRGDLLRRAGRGAEAVTAFQEALESAPTEAERGLLRRRLDELTGPPRPADVR